SIVLIGLAALHIGEEVVAGFRRFFNVEWFAGTEDCPVSRTKGLLVDQIGLFLLMAGAALIGSAIDARLLLVPIGIITADLVQHGIFSVVKARYTPGVGTSALYLAYVVYFFTRNELKNSLYLDWAWLALTTGIVLIAGNYLFSRARVRSGRCG